MSRRILCDDGLSLGCVPVTPLVFRVFRRCRTSPRMPALPTLHCSRERVGQRLLDARFSSVSRYVSIAIRATSAMERWSSFAALSSLA